MSQRRRARWLFAALCLSSGGCSPPSEAPRVALPIVVDASGVVPVVTDLEYEVEISAARVVIQDLVFTVAGDVHTSAQGRGLFEAIFPVAYAHPGHYQGGEVTGELLGDFVVDWPADEGRALGVTTLLVATYRAANFTFGRGSPERLSADDPLLGHTAVLSGTATRAEQRIRFTIVVDSPEGRALVGAPFEASVDAETRGALRLRFNTLDGLEGDSIFDAIDFAALDEDGDGIVVIEPGAGEVEDAYNSFRRAFQTHDHYSVELQE